MWGQRGGECVTKMGQKSTHVIFSPFEPSARHSSSWQRSPSAYRVAARREERVEREERERRERERARARKCGVCGCAQGTQSREKQRSWLLRGDGIAGQRVAPTEQRNTTPAQKRNACVKGAGRVRACVQHRSTAPPHHLAIANACVHARACLCVCVHTSPLCSPAQAPSGTLRRRPCPSCSSCRRSCRPSPCCSRPCHSPSPSPSEASLHAGWRAAAAARGRTNRL